MHLVLFLFLTVLADPQAPLAQICRLALHKSVGRDIISLIDMATEEGIGLKGNDYLIEARLYVLDPQLHKRFSDSVFVLQKLLTDYLVLFPEYTDHTETHSIAIIDYCNNIMGPEGVARLNADELYVLLMASYLHDVGMGVSKKDFWEFLPLVCPEKYEELHEEIDRDGMAKGIDLIRAYHNDFSACFIHKYAPLFDFPSELHEFAVAQTARGHRKADLFDENSYPARLCLDNGNTVSLPYTAALVRLGDEVNVAKDRNSVLIFDPSNYTTEKQRIENAKHEAIKKMTIYQDRIELVVETDDPGVREAVDKLAVKLQKTLDYCVKVVDERTEFEITQKKILLL